MPQNTEPDIEFTGVGFQAEIPTAWSWLGPLLPGRGTVDYTRGPARGFGGYGWKFPQLTVKKQGAMGQMINAFCHRIFFGHEDDL